MASPTPPPTQPMARPLPWKVAWVTGASSGIGREIVLQLAAKGVKVAASSRKGWPDPLPANVVSFPLDVTDAAAVDLCIAQIERQLGPLDLVVLGAGAYQPFDLASCDVDEFARINATNYLGVTNCVVPLLHRMVARGSGHISWIASVAGYGGLPKAGYYGPTKAALINLAESLWHEAKPKGVAISVINPGFVETPMVKSNDFPMPFLMKADRAAAITIDGLERKKFEIAYPLPFVLILKFLQRLPVSWRLRLVGIGTGNR